MGSTYDTAGGAHALLWWVRVAVGAWGGCSFTGMPNSHDRENDDELRRRFEAHVLRCYGSWEAYREQMRAEQSAQEIDLIRAGADLRYDILSLLDAGEPHEFRCAERIAGDLGHSPILIAETLLMMALLDESIEAALCPDPETPPHSRWVYGPRRLDHT